ncbi:uncharacterized protein LOC135831731 [Planococcus citri]|uniref:uncharacterized protein LOC135831731 n=1 Tax=Planococcus citri TaxID=170843 RepID=UPI0031F762BA
MENKATAKGRHTCVACGSRGSKGFFRLPQDPFKRTIWFYQSGIAPLSEPSSRNAWLCNKHFEKTHISIGKKRMGLKKCVIPWVKVDPAPDKTDRKAYCMNCYVCGKTNADSFHRIPKDPKIRDAWIRNVGIRSHNRIPPSNMRLCNSHFLECDFVGHAYSVRRLLSRDAVPLRNLQKGSNQIRQSPISPKIINNDGDVINPSNREVTSVSSSSSNTRCTTTLNDDAESESKISKANPQNSKTISFPKERNISGENTSDQSTVSSSKKENAVPIVTDSMTSENVGESSIAEPTLEKKQRRIRRLKEKRKLLRKQLAEHRELLDNLLKENLVTKKGKKMIKAFLRSLLNPIE